ncbi:kinase-like (PK-like) [Fusarium beomiforme]|uniref:Kinase-like (PK-like) n=1 Tax=Fusarium beomiforme TaxID=44412 RepID=A0A9P5A2X4_9HYPO|nr:kinase-like (PK-like) [Fusarium beomiforme]
MIDPLSIAGLTIAVIDQLWKVSERTAELISNFREYDNVGILNQTLYIYGNKTMFEQFDSEVQNQIQVLFEQATGVINEAFQILSRRQGKTDANKAQTESSSQSSSSSHLVSMPMLVVPASKSSPKSSSTENLLKAVSVQRLRWSLLDKKRIEVIVHNFSDLNARIHENVKLWSLATSMGIDLQHLERLKENNDAKTLGFDVDAKLHMVATMNQPISQTLEVEDPLVRQGLNNVTTFEEKFGIFHWDGKPMLVEYRSYNLQSPVPVDLDPRSKDLVDSLASLLHQPKEMVFRTPRCTGWVRQINHNRVAYIFAVPEGGEPAPVSLLKALPPLGSSSTSQLPTPSLGHRFQLAHKLAKCISQLQLVKWVMFLASIVLQALTFPTSKVHESFRSENILFFPQPSTEATAYPAETRLNLTEPWVLGFKFSRPEMYFSHGHGDYNAARDVYRHPRRQQNPTEPFNKLHDVYALGVVLLEIGLWQPAMSLERHGFSSVKEPEAIQKYLIKVAEKRLSSKVGEKYQKVVLKCLRGNFEVDNDTKEDMKLQLAFRSQVVDVLEKIADAI